MFRHRRSAVRPALAVGPLAAVIVAGLAACADPSDGPGSSPSSPGAEASTASAEPGPSAGVSTDSGATAAESGAPGVVTVVRPAGSTAESMMALLEGTLAVRDGCVVVESGDAVTLPAFPAGARWSEDHLTLGDANWAVGDPVSIGGGFVPVAGFGSGDGSTLEVPAACGGYTEVFVVGSLG